MLEYNDNLIFTIIVYLIISYVLYNSKNNIMFDNNGKFKKFGLNKDETIFPFWLVSLIIGLFIYYFRASYVN